MGYLEFREVPNEPKKTRLFSVVSAGAVLGVVKYYSPWGKYCLFPHGQTLWDPACLGEVAEFCRRKTEEQRAGG